MREFVQVDQNGDVFHYIQTSGDAPGGADVIEVTTHRDKVSAGRERDWHLKRYDRLTGRFNDWQG